MFNQTLFEDPREYFQYRFQDSIYLLVEVREIHMGVADKSLLRKLALEATFPYLLDSELGEDPVTREINAIQSGFEDAVKLFYYEILVYRPNINYKLI